MYKVRIKDLPEGIEIRPFMEKDFEIIKRLRKIDVREITRDIPEEEREASAEAALRLNVLESHETWAFVKDGVIEGLCGFSYTEECEYMHPMLLITDNFFTMWSTRQMLVHVTDILKYICSFNKPLINLVAEENKTVIRWLSFLGFTFEDYFDDLEVDGYIYKFFYLKAGGKFKCVEQ